LAVAKDIFVWIVGPRRSVNYFNCTVWKLILLFYLLNIYMCSVLTGAEFIEQTSTDDTAAAVTQVCNLQLASTHVCYIVIDSLIVVFNDKHLST